MRKEAYGLEYLFIFALGALGGWVLEILYRNMYRLTRGMEGFVNPGFLSGPYLPLYGMGMVYLYLLSTPPMPLAFRVLLFALGTTLLEGATGLIFLKTYRIRLWDYSDEWANWRGIVCPKYSLYWTLLSLGFYRWGYPLLDAYADQFFSHPFALFFLGFFGGFFTQDTGSSFQLASRIRRAVAGAVQAERRRRDVSLAELRPEFRSLNLDRFKDHFRRWRRQGGNLHPVRHFINPFKHIRYTDLGEQIEDYFGRLRRRLENGDDKLENGDDKGDS